MTSAEDVGTRVPTDDDQLALDTVRLLEGVRLELLGISGWVNDPDVIQWLERFVEQFDRAMGNLHRLGFDLSHARG